MAVARINKTKSQENWLFDFLKKYWYVIILALVCYPVLVKIYDYFQGLLNDSEDEKQKKINAEAVQNPLTKAKGLDEITTRTDLQNIAQNVANHLGTDINNSQSSIWSVLNPRSWTENDSDAFDELIKIKQISSWNLVRECYFFLTGNDMEKDCRKLLDTKYKNKLIFLN